MSQRSEQERRGDERTRRRMASSICSLRLFLCCRPWDEIGKRSLNLKMKATTGLQNKWSQLLIMAEGGLTCTLRETNNSITERGVYHSFPDIVSRVRTTKKKKYERKHIKDKLWQWNLQEESHKDKRMTRKRRGHSKWWVTCLLLHVYRFLHASSLISWQHNSCDLTYFAYKVYFLSRNQNQVLGYSMWDLHWEWSPSISGNLSSSEWWKLCLYQRR